MTGEIQKWADAAMFRAEDMPEEARRGPQVHLLSMTPDPLGTAAAMNAMYVGKVKRGLHEVTREERLALIPDMQSTALKLPMESIRFHFLFEGVTRAFTHQLVRTRMAGYAQESMRFAVFGDGVPMPVALPPSLQNTKGGEPLGAEDSTPEYMRNLWDQAINNLEQTYAHLVDSGMPAEDARGLLPTNIQTRLHMIVDLRTLQQLSGMRLCTQAQFEWRAVFAGIAKAIRSYNPMNPLLKSGQLASHERDFLERIGQADEWQYEAIADLFRPICYFTGKCEFKATADRKCSIRERVDANSEIGRSSEHWAQDFLDQVPEMAAYWSSRNVQRADNESGKPVFIGAIQPREWLLNPAAAR